MHLDLDAFFASAHRIYDNSLHDIPIAVGGRSDPFIFDKKIKNRKMSIKNSGAFVPTLFFNENNKNNFENYFKDGNKIRGIIMTASYEARAYGIKTGMSIAEALRRCPTLLVLTPNQHLYHELSNELKVFLFKEIPLVEQYSIDEFFGDVEGWIDNKDVYQFALTLKQKIYKEFKLPISIGIANTKWIAKLATNAAKPDGIKLITKKEHFEFIKNTPIEKFPGIGKAYQKKLLSYRKKTLSDIINSKTLLYSWGRSGRELYDRVSGEDKDKIIHKKDRKSIGISRTFDPIQDRNELKRRVFILVRHLSFIVHKLNVQPSTLSFSIRYKYQEKSKKQQSFTRLFNEHFFQQIALEMFISLDIHTNFEIIRLSLSLSNFNSNIKKQYSLLEFEKDRKFHALQQAQQKLREKYGMDIIKNGCEL